MLRLRHAVRLMREIVGDAVVNRMLWLIPLVIVLGVVTAVVVAGGSAAPYTMYTLF